MSPHEELVSFDPCAGSGPRDVLSIKGKGQFSLRTLSSWLCFMCGYIGRTRRAATNYAKTTKSSKGVGLEG